MPNNYKNSILVKTLEMRDSKLYHVFVYTVYLVIEDSANLTVFKNSHQHNLQLIET